jgi:hypothetical protein
MLKLYFENFKKDELSFAIEDEQGDRVDRIWFKGNIIMPKVFDVAVIAYLSKLNQDLDILGPVSAGLTEGALKWREAMGLKKVKIKADLKIGSSSLSETWLMNETLNTFNITHSEIEDPIMARIAAGLLFAGKFKGILLEQTDIAYELLDTNNFKILSNGRSK